MPPSTATKPGRSRSTEKAPADYLHDALEDLDKAREKAGEEVGANIDSARERIGEAREDMTRRGQDQVRDWREQFGNAADDALRELGRWAIHGQRNPDALTELSKEISQRQAELSA